MGASRARSRAIRALMAADGLPYMEAMRRYDAARAPAAGPDPGAGRSPAGGTIPPPPPAEDLVPVFLAPAEVITDPDRAEALGLTADARRMRATPQE